jgi:hypothetical protein
MHKLHNAVADSLLLLLLRIPEVKANRTEIYRFPQPLH